MNNEQDLPIVELHIKEIKDSESKFSFPPKEVAKTFQFPIIRQGYPVSPEILNFRVKILLDIITDTNEKIPFMIVETEDKQEFFVRVNDQEVFTYEQFAALPKKEIRWNV